MRFFRAVARQSHTQCGFFSSRLWLWALLLGNSALKNGTNTDKFKNTRKMMGFLTFSQFFPENVVFNAVFPSGSSAEPHPGKHFLETAARSPCAQLLRMPVFLVLSSFGDADPKTARQRATGPHTQGAKVQYDNAFPHFVWSSLSPLALEASARKLRAASRQPAKFNWRTRVPLRKGQPPIPLRTKLLKAACLVFGCLCFFCLFQLSGHSF